MRKVVDSNYLQSPKLRDYLEKARNNLVVLTDYAAMEAYKGDTLTSIYKSMSILSNYPEQVVILKSTQIVCGLSGKKSGLQNRLIDASQTKDFKKYCRALNAAHRGSSEFEKQLLNHGHEAESHLDKMLVDADSIRHSFEEISKNYTEEELRMLRTESNYTAEMFDNFIKGVMLAAGCLFRDHRKARDWPEAKTVHNRFIFRAALCTYLLALDWIAAGGAKDAKVEKLRNDMVDTNFAAFATYFDGLLTEDKKLHRVYRHALTIIDSYFERITGE